MAPKSLYKEKCYTKKNVIVSKASQALKPQTGGGDIT